MTVDYLPVIMDIDHPHPDLVQWSAERFETLNNRHVHIVRREQFPSSAQAVHKGYLYAWIWDVVPKTTKRVMFLSSYVVPLRPLPQIPDASFVAARDAKGYAEAVGFKYPIVARNGFFNKSFFVARRDTTPIFDQLKATAVDKSTADPTHGDFGQTPFNLLVQSSLDVTWLPHSCNTILLCSRPEAALTASILNLCALPMNTCLVLMNLFRTALGLSELPKAE